MIALYLVLTVAQAAGNTDFWDTDLGQDIRLVISVFIAIAAVAGGVKGMQYLTKSALGAHLWGMTRWRERRHREQLLDEMLSPDGWPSLVQEVQGLRTVVDDLCNILGHPNGK